MNGPTPIPFAVEIAFAAANVLVWTGLFLYLLHLARRVRRLEGTRSGRVEPMPRGNDLGAAQGGATRRPG